MGQWEGTEAIHVRPTGIDVIAKSEAGEEPWRDRDRGDLDSMYCSCRGIRAASVSAAPYIGDREAKRPLRRTTQDTCAPCTGEVDAQRSDGEPDERCDLQAGNRECY